MLDERKEQEPISPFIKRSPANRSKQAKATRFIHIDFNGTGGPARKSAALAAQSSASSHVLCFGGPASRKINGPNGTGYLQAFYSSYSYFQQQVRTVLNKFLNDKDTKTFNISKLSEAFAEHFKSQRSFNYIDNSASQRISEDSPMTFVLQAFSRGCINAKVFLDELIVALKAKGINNYKVYVYLNEPYVGIVGEEPAIFLDQYRNQENIKFIRTRSNPQDKAEPLMIRQFANPVILQKIDNLIEIPHFYGFSHDGTVRLKFYNHHRKLDQLLQTANPQFLWRSYDRSPLKKEFANMYGIFLAFQNPFVFKALADQCFNVNKHWFLQFIGFFQHVLTSGKLLEDLEDIYGDNLQRYDYQSMQKIFIDLYLNNNKRIKVRNFTFTKPEVLMLHACGVQDPDIYRYTNDVNRDNDYLKQFLKSFADFYYPLHKELYIINKGHKKRHKNGKHPSLTAFDNWYEENATALCTNIYRLCNTELKMNADDCRTIFQDTLFRINQLYFIIDAIGKRNSNGHAHSLMQLFVEFVKNVCNFLYCLFKYRSIKRDAKASLDQIVDNCEASFFSRINVCNHQSQDPAQEQALDFSDEESDSLSVSFT